MSEPKALAEQAIAIADSIGGELGRQLRALVERRPAVESVVPAEPERVVPAGDHAIHAALADTFTLEEIGALVEADRNAILQNAASVMIGGRRRLRLTDECRGEIINRHRDGRRYAEILNDAVLKDSDPIEFHKITRDPIRLPTAWMRSFLKNDFGDYTSAPPSELRAAVSALERLRFVPLAESVPKLEEMQRRLELAELLEPLRILVGSTSWDGKRGEDRFVGRESQIRQMRSYVDELESESVGEVLGRAVERVKRGLQSVVAGKDVGTLSIVAAGGLGKSTLIAKFVLDHALAPRKRIPFTYLDFDRATLRPRDPRTLLLEAAKQVALQFPDVAGRMGVVQAMVRAEMAGERKAKGAVTDPFEVFVKAVTTKVTRQKRAFLLVLDTMEFVQHDPKALDGVLAFVERLILHSDFPELRIVVSGRAGVPELTDGRAWLAKGDSILLKPLSVEEAEKMAQSLGARLMAKEWNEPWASMIAGKETDRDDRREPLSVRVAVEALRSAPPEARDPLARDIATMGIDAHESFVGKLYERRVLDHVQGPARKLAWPGLVVRRITPELVREALAGPCELESHEMDPAFDALAEEVWIVTRDPSGGLRHQPDLRAKTLPLMKRSNPERFKKVNDAAIKYFYDRRSEDLANHAEWLYHRLLGGETYQDVERNWVPGVDSYLANAAPDFSRQPEISDYLMARTSRQLLPREQISRMPARFAMDHISRTSQRLGAFDDNRIEPLLLELPLFKALGESPSDMVAAACASLAVKTGRWNFEWPRIRDPGTWANRFDFAYRFRRAHAGIEADEPLSWQPEAMSGFRGRTLELARQRILHPEASRENEDQLIESLNKAEALEHADSAILRLAMTFGDSSGFAALHRWIAMARRSDTRQATLCLAEIRAIAKLGPGAGIDTFIRGVFQEMEIEPAFLDAENSTGKARIAHPAVHRIIAQLAAATENSTAYPNLLWVMHRFAAARDESWIVPLAYSAANSLETVPAAAREWVEACNVEPSRAKGLLRNTGESPFDMLTLFRMADEAGGLKDVVDLVAAQAPPQSDFQRLQSHYQRWRAGVDRWLRR